MGKVYVRTKHFLTLLQNRNPEYVLDSNNTVADFLDVMSRDFNHNFYHYPVRLVSGKDSQNVFDFQTKLKDLPIYTESYFLLSISPSAFELHKDEGYSPPE